jgi:hypothetical protein
MWLRLGRCVEKHRVLCVYMAVMVVLQAYLGPPSAAARYEILRSGVLELARAGLIAGGLCGGAT